jgi:long-chain acyl-CoA synthetase
VTPTSPYAARPWLRHYDYWVPPHLTYPSRPLGDVLAIAAVHRPNGTATHFLGAELTFGDLKQQSDALAVALAELGVAKGDRVGIMLPNCPQYIVATFGILRLGAVVVNVNPSYTPREAAIVAADSGIRAVITLDVLAPLVAGIRTASSIEQVIVTSVAEYSAAATPPDVIDGTLRLCDLLSAGTSRAPGSIASPQIGRDDLAVLQYTGGTTGTPKGAMLTHGNIFANVVQASSWTNPRYALGGEERYLVVIPYFHIYAFSVCMMTAIWINAQQIIHPKYDPDQVLASILKFHPTYFPAVPTLFVSLLNHPRVGEFGLDRVRHFNSGGAPCPLEVLIEFERRIGRPLTEGYGLSETSPVTHSTTQLGLRKLGTVGLPMPDTDLKVVDVETGQHELPLGEAGELCIAGPQVMAGYWNKPDETAQALRADSDGRIWFHTGDIAVVDADGFTSIVQRKKDMIIVDGYNVYPSEIEAVLYQHPAIRLAAAIGVPDPYHGETVKACVALKPGATVSADELVAYCRNGLTEYKVPRSVEIRETLPMSAVGKILYRVLREEHG